MWDLILSGYIIEGIIGGGDRIPQYADAADCASDLSATDEFVLIQNSPSC